MYEIYTQLLKIKYGMPSSPTDLVGFIHFMALCRCWSVIGEKDKLPKEIIVIIIIIIIIHFRTTATMWCIGMMLPIFIIIMIGLRLSVDE